ITVGNAAWDGGYGGSARTFDYITPMKGIVDGALPVGGHVSGPGRPGAGCGGGAASITQAAQDGASAVLGAYGAGGGGGGASVNGFNSGKGGDGGPGYVRIRFVYNASAAPGTGMPEGV